MKRRPFISDLQFERPASAVAWPARRHWGWRWVVLWALLAVLLATPRSADAWSNGQPIINTAR